MLATRWQPFGDLWDRMNRFQDEMNRAFRSLGLDDEGWRGLAVAYPALNVWEDSDHVYAEAELPGMELDDLEIYVTGGNTLTIKGQRKQPVADGTWHRQERGFGTFARVVTLPVDVDADQVEAKFAQGLLTITMPKTPTAKPKKIAVKTD
jgi:HSP20 family protein